VSVIVERNASRIIYRAIGENFDLEIRSINLPQKFDTEPIFLFVDLFTIDFILDENLPFGLQGSFKSFSEKIDSKLVSIFVYFQAKKFCRACKVIFINFTLCFE